MSDNAPRQPEVPTESQIHEWLAYKYGDMIKEGADNVAALNSLIEKFSNGLPDEEAAEVAGQNLAIAGALTKTAAERRLEENLPYRDGQKIVNQWFEDFITSAVDRPRVAVQKMLNEYGAAKRRKQQQEAAAIRQRAQEEAIRKAAEARRALAEARPEAGGLVEQAARAAEKASEANQTVQEAGRVRVTGTMGSISSATVTWEPQITDFSLIPDYFKMIDRAKLAEAMRDRDLDGKKTGTKGKPTAVIPGITWVENFTMRNR